MSDPRASLEKLKQTSTEELKAHEASLRAAEARLSAFKDSAAALGPQTGNNAATAALVRRLEEKMKKEQIEIVQLQARVEHARARADGFDDVLRLLPRDGEDEIRAGTTMHEARQVLRTAGHPMQLDDILKALNLANRDDKRNSLRSSLAKYAAKGTVFTKTGADTFGLIEFHSHTANEKTQ